MDLRRQQRNWEMLQQQLGAEARGEPPRVFSSTRTLFGIRSTVEQQLDAFVAEEEARKKAEREAAVVQDWGKNAQPLGVPAGDRPGPLGVAQGQDKNAQSLEEEKFPEEEKSLEEENGNRSHCED